MSKRLQVLLEEEELDQLRESARRKGVTVSEYVRQAVRDARRREPTRDVESKLRVIRRAAQYNFPAPDIEQMLEEIESGYPTELPEIRE